MKHCPYHCQIPTCPRRVSPIPRDAARRGSITVLTAFLLIVFLALVAFSLDIGYMMLIRTELQRTADAAALASAWELTTQEDVTLALPEARSAALEYTGRNPVGRRPTELDANLTNDLNGDLVIGSIADFQRVDDMDFSDRSSFNAVQVRVRRDQIQNGEVPLFFARFLGRDRVSLRATATAAVTRNVIGFQPPPNSTPVPMLPIAIELDTWENIIRQDNAQDAYTWDETLEEVVTGPDDRGEGHLYPTRTDAPGNFGTLNIGTSNNSTRHLSDQILHGLSKSDFAYHGGELRLDANGELTLTGDPGVSSTIVSELADIQGQPRIVPVYNQLVESGSNAVYTIIGFAGVRIMAVRGHGTKMQVTIQAADVATGGTIPGTGEPRSQFVFSTPRLVK